MTAQKYMKISTKRFLILSFLLVLSVAWLVTTVQGVSAAVEQKGMTEVGGAYGTTQGDVRDVRSIAIDVINISLSLLSVIMVALLIFSGYQWMMSGGDSKVIETAQARIKNAVIGLVIIFAAWSISAFVLDKAVGVTTGTTSSENGSAGMQFVK